MKKEETTTARTGWKIWLEKTSQSLKEAWKFANEFDLIEKAKKYQNPPFGKNRRVGLAVKRQKP